MWRRASHRWVHKWMGCSVPPRSESSRPGISYAGVETADWAHSRAGGGAVDGPVFGGSPSGMRAGSRVQAGGADRLDLSKCPEPRCSC